MEPANPASFLHRTERLATGRTYHFVDEIPQPYDRATCQTMLLVHGFPDLWYGWRYQIAPWVARGYRVVVPDMLGYGGTDKPGDAREYSTRRLCNDLAALLDLLGVQKAVVIGHDWGSYTVGRFALWHPDRLSALVMMSVPFTPPAPKYLPIEEVARRVPNLGYQVYFADPQSTSEIERNLGLFMRLLTQTPGRRGEGTSMVRQGQMQKLVLSQATPKGPLRTVLSDSELTYYESQMRQGMNGPLSYYRTSKERFEEEKAANLSSSLRPDLPVLYLYGTEDPTGTPVQMQRASKWIPKLKVVPLEGKGHWIMVEARDQVTREVLEWLEASPSGSSLSKSKL